MCPTDCRSNGMNKNSEPRKIRSSLPRFQTERTYGIVSNNFQLLGPHNGPSVRYGRTMQTQIHKGV